LLKGLKNPFHNLSHSKNLSNIASADLLEPGKDCLSRFASALSHLALLAQERTRSVTAKNPTASKGTGGMASPDPSGYKPFQSGRVAEFAKVWNVRPFTSMGVVTFCILTRLLAH
jgi:hypothetical protein